MAKPIPLNQRTAHEISIMSATDSNRNQIDFANLMSL
jgi:hypothetical protein